MEKYQEDLELAWKKVKIADHMVNVTFPMVRDSKLLLATLENAFLAFTNTMSALLHYERLYKRIPPFNATFESKYFLYTHTVQSKFELDNEFAKIMREIKTIIMEHHTSPVEFAKNDNYVICSKNYKTVVLKHKDIKGYVSKAKLFIQEINTIINKKNER